MEPRQPPTADGPPSGHSTLCTPFLTRLPISGAVISITDRAGHRTTVAASDPAVARWDELELELGIGPLHDALLDSAPVMIGDLRGDDRARIIGAHLESLGIRAVFALPLLLGAATIGVVGLYRSSPGALSSESLEVALALARATAVPAVRAALGSAESSAPVDRMSAPGIRREVHQATGMISAQLSITVSDAFARLRAHALVNERSVTDVAHDVVDGRLNFRTVDPML